MAAGGLIKLPLSRRPAAAAAATAAAAADAPLPTRRTPPSSWLPLPLLANEADRGEYAAGCGCWCGCCGATAGLCVRERPAARGVDAPDDALLAAECSGECVCDAKLKLPVWSSTEPTESAADARA